MAITAGKNLAVDAGVSGPQVAVAGSGAFQPGNVGIGIAVAVVTLTRTVEATIGTGTTIAQGANLTPADPPLTVNGRSYTGVAVHGEWVGDAIVVAASGSGGQGRRHPGGRHPVTRRRPGDLQRDRRERTAQRSAGPQGR